MEQANVSPQLIRTLLDGFTIPFEFVDGLLSFDLFPDKKYEPKEIIKGFRACHISETIIYRLQLPDGLKGYAIVTWDSLV